VKVAILVGAAFTCSFITSADASTFTDYLLKQGLENLYRAELHKCCLEDNDIESCLRYADEIGKRGLAEKIDGLIDSIGTDPLRVEITKLILKARSLLGQGKCNQAIAYAERAIGLLPPKDLLIEAMLVRAKSAYRLEEMDLMATDVEALVEYVDPATRPDLALLSGVVNEHTGRLDEAQRLLEIALRGGLYEAGPELLKVLLKEEDREGFSSYLDSLPPCTEPAIAEGLCDIAHLLEGVYPAVWHEVVGHLANDSTFIIDAHPEIVNDIVRAAEAGEAVGGYCAALLRNSSRSSSVESLRYAHAIAMGSVDSLVILLKQSRNWILNLKCAVWIAALASEADPAVDIALADLGKILSTHGDEIPDVEMFAIAKLLATRSSRASTPEIIKHMCNHLEATSQPDVLLELANLERSISPERSAEKYKRIASAPLPSLKTLEAERALWEMRVRKADTSGIAQELEKIVDQGADAFGVANLLVERLGAFERAIPLYRRAIEELRQTDKQYLAKMGLVECLIRVALKRQVGDDARQEIRRLLRELAASRARVDDVLDLTKASTIFLRKDYDFANEVLEVLRQRKDLSAGDTYGLLRFGFYLFLLGHSGASTTCDDLVEQLLRAYPSSAATGLGVLLRARIRFLLGDYVGALKLYRLCLKRWNELAPICNRGIGECYLYSGGLLKAITYFKLSEPDARTCAEIGKCYQILDQNDSAEVYLSKALNSLSFDPFTTTASAGLGLILLERGDSPDVISFLDPSFGAWRHSILRERYSIRCILKAYYLAKLGYGFANSALRVESMRNQRIACLARLLGAEIAVDEDGERALAILPHAGQCFDIFGFFDVMTRQALYACMVDSVDLCNARISQFIRRFPLASSTINTLRDEMVLQVFKSGRGERALELIDSLRAEGYVPGLKIDFRKGIQFMLERRYRDAIKCFRALAATADGTDMYYDSCFKLGTAYYFAGVYDSSAHYFSMAASAPGTELVREALFNGGLAQVEAGNHAGAFESFWTYAIKFPLSKHFQRALLRAAFALEEMDQYGRAIEVYRRFGEYASSIEEAAEAHYWMGHAYAQMGDHVRAAVEYLRVGYMFPQVDAWAGTASFEAGLACEKAGLTDEAIIIYRETARKYGEDTDWGKAALQRLQAVTSETGG